MEMKYIILLFCLFISTKVDGQLDSLVWDGMHRTYLLHLPTNYTENEALPLIIAMHGGFGSANNLENQSQLSIKSNQEKFIVVYPEGVQGGVFNIRTWNAGLCCGHASESNIDDVGFINELLNKLLKDYSIDPNRVYATGMSNGGFMAYRLACELSDRIAAIAPVAASMSIESCTPSRPVPIIHFHSYLDTNVRIEGGIGTGASSLSSSPLDSVLNVWSASNDCMISSDTVVNNELFSKIEWSDCSCNSLLQLYITEDGGHSWPGGMRTLLGDPISTAINANDLMWDFFQNYTVQCETVSATAPQKPSLNIYPNPAKNLIEIEFDNPTSDWKVLIYDIKGALKLSTLFGNQIDISNLNPGTYLISLMNDHEIVTGTFLKIK